MKELEEKLKSLKMNVESAMRFESDDENEEYVLNKSTKMPILDFILVTNQLLKTGSLEKMNYDELLDQSLKVLTENTGCAEDLEILEDIFDELIDNKVLTKDEYKELMENSSVARWF